LDAGDVARVIDRIEHMLPIGVRQRQLSVRTLLLGILLALADARPGHLTRVHQALIGLGLMDRWRLGIIMATKFGPHLLTYRQVERTFGLVSEALAKQIPDGQPSQLLRYLTDSLLEASVPDAYKEATSSVGVDWTDLEAFSRPAMRKGGMCFDPEASWGHRRANHPGARDQLFFGYYLQFATMVTDDGGPAVAELARRLLLTSCHVDPPTAFCSVLEDMANAGISITDVLCDSGYSHRVPANWAARVRRSGANLVMDLHPTDRGPQGTHKGAVIANGCLYCPCTPVTLLNLRPLKKDATGPEIETADLQALELERYRLGRITRDDQDGYHRVMCPAEMRKVRCPLRSESMTLPTTAQKCSNLLWTHPVAVRSPRAPSQRTSRPRRPRNTPTCPKHGVSPTRDALPPSARTRQSKILRRQTFQGVGAGSPVSHRSPCS
jgi:hypothetical protein